MSVRRPALLVLPLAVCAAAPAAAQAVLLRMAPPAGQVTHYRTVNQSWVRLPGDSSADTTRPYAEQTTWTTRTVGGLEGETRLVTTVVDSSATVMPSLGGAPPGGDLLRGMRLTQRIDTRGRILSTDVTPPPGLPATMARRIADNASRASTVLPERAIRPGETWTDSMPMAAPDSGAEAPSAFRMTYTLQRIEHAGGARIAHIRLSGVVPADSAHPDQPAPGPMTGELAIDLEAGRLVRQTTEVVVPLQMPNGTVPMRITSLMEALP